MFRAFGLRGHRGVVYFTVYYCVYMVVASLLFHVKRLCMGFLLGLHVYMQFSRFCQVYQGFCFEAPGLFSNLRVCTIYRSSFRGFTLAPNNLTFPGLI